MTNEKTEQTVAEIIQTDLAKQIAQEIHMKTVQTKQIIQTMKMIQMIQQQD